MFAAYSQPYCRVSPYVPSQPSLANAVQYWSLGSFPGIDHTVLVFPCNKCGMTSLIIHTKALIEYKLACEDHHIV